VADLSSTLAALANDHRRTIVGELATQPRSISSLAQEIELSLPAIHKHIARLEEAGLLRRRKIGRTNYVTLEREPLQELQAWIGGFQPWWGTGDESLTNYADRDGSASKEKS
jgi:DNA-binding transcriptional ArsR family regulator